MRLAEHLTVETVLDYISQIELVFHGKQDTYHLCTTETKEEAEEAAAVCNSYGLPFDFFYDDNIEGDDIDGLFVLGCCPKEAQDG